MAVSSAGTESPSAAAEPGGRAAAPPSRSLLGLPSAGDAEGSISAGTSSDAAMLFGASALASAPSPSVGAVLAVSGSSGALGPFHR
jgi:hypothetical protein